MGIWRAKEHHQLLGPNNQHWGQQDHHKDLPKGTQPIPVHPASVWTPHFNDGGYHLRSHAKTNIAKTPRKTTTTIWHRSYSNDTWQEAGMCQSRETTFSQRMQSYNYNHRAQLRPPLLNLQTRQPTKSASSSTGTIIEITPHVNNYGHYTIYIVMIRFLQGWASS